MGILDEVREELVKRSSKQDKIDLTTIPTAVLKRVQKRFGDNEEWTVRALRAWREPEKPSGLCQCTETVFQIGDQAGIDCWLCGGYSY